ncbi:MAG: helix-turn-helix domain-containing protein [Thermoguttaceae bacterium]
MAQKYYNVKETAELFGKSEDDVRQMLERRELHGYRDGADWKFKSEDVERLAAELKTTDAPAEETDQVLLSEVELGQSGIGASGTVIGMEKPALAPDSDIQLGESDVELDSKTAVPPIGKNRSDSQKTKFEELDLALEEDLSLPDSDIGLDEVRKPTSDSPTGVSAVELGVKPLDDDDVVIGSGSSGSGVTLSGDSGISLVDPADSGISLEEPRQKGPELSSEMLELADEDDLQIIGSSVGGPALKPDDDFLLTPTEEVVEGDESETGSQVIALESEGDEVALQAPGQGMGAIFEEGLGAAPGMEFPAAGSGLGIQGLGLAAGEAMIPEGSAAAFPTAGVLPEAPYTVGNIVVLSLCVLFLLLCGAMLYDLLRNMWTWQSAGSVNTWLMDTILSFFE